LHLEAAWGDPQGQHALVTAQGSASVHDTQSATALGEAVAGDLQRAVAALDADR
jgi:hydroxymethylbilane synthase